MMSSVVRKQGQIYGRYSITGIGGEGFEMR